MRFDVAEPAGDSLFFQATFYQLMTFLDRCSLPGIFVGFANFGAFSVFQDRHVDGAGYCATDSFPRGSEINQRNGVCEEITQRV